MEEREINLIGMLFNILLHWRSLIVAGLIGSFIVGGYNAVKVASEVATTTEESMTISDEDMEAVSVYANNVRIYESMQDAWTQSAYMALDGNNVAKTGLMLIVKGKRADRMANIAKAYQDMAVSTGAVDYICKEEGIPNTEIVKLINIDTTINTNTNTNTNTANTYIGDITSYVCSDDEHDCMIPLYIEVLGQDEAASEQMADLLVEYLSKAKNDIAINMGEHSLTVLSKNTTVGIDSNVINKQNTNYNTLSKIYDTVITQKNKLSGEQLEYYKSVLSENDEEDIVTEAEQSIGSEPTVDTLSLGSFINIKLIVIGLFAGILCMVGLRSVLYILNNRIKSEDSMESLFKVAVIGVIPADYEKKRILGFIDKLIISIRDRNKRMFSVDEAVSLVVSRVKVQSRKVEVSKLVLVGCDLDKNVPVIPQAMAKELKAGDINAFVLDNVLYNPENTEKLGEMDGAVIIEKAGKTLYSELAEEIELLKRQQIKLLGCVIVE